MFATGCYFPLINGELGVGQAGLISVVPGAVVVAPGGTTQLRPELLAPDGTRADPQPAFTFVSLDPSTATVDSNGLVTGVAIGVATIEIGDGVHGTVTIGVAVDASVPAGPVAITCVPALVLVTPGTTVTPQIVITDASGTPISSPTVTFSIDDPSIASVDAAGAVTGVSVGSAFLSANGPSGPLAGGCNVLVVTNGSSGGGRCDDVYQDFCYPSRNPYRFADPGLSYPIRVQAGTFRVAGCGLPMGQFTTEQAADEVMVEDSGVVAFFGGRMQAVAPGRTHYRVRWHGVDCSESDVSVGVSFNGTWQMQCGNGDRGVLPLSGGPRGVMAPYSSGGETHTIAFAHGNGQICTVDPEPMSCTDLASASMGPIRVQLASGGHGTCASGGGCRMSVSHCGTRGTGDGLLDSFDRFHVGDCVYTRGGSATLDLGACQAPMGACTDLFTLPCPGVRLQACATGDLGACWIEVSGRRFTCTACGDDGCMLAAADYAAMLCP